MKSVSSFGDYFASELSMRYTRGMRKKKLLQKNPLLVFKLNGSDYALPLDLVKRVTRMKDVTAFTPPKAPPETIDYNGLKVPLHNLRREMGAETDSYSEKDRLIIVNTKSGVSALLVDEVTQVGTELGAETVLFQKLEERHHIRF